MDKWYIKREEERKMLEEINQIAIDKQNEKKEFKIKRGKILLFFSL